MMRGVHVATMALLLLVPFARGGWRARWRATPSPPSSALAALPPVVGDPLPGAADVRLVRSLLRLVPSDVTVEVLVDTAGFPGDGLRYLAYQLLHLEYPRVVPVRAPRAGAPAPRVWQIVGPDVVPSPTLISVAAAGAYRLFRRDR